MMVSDVDDAAGTTAVDSLKQQGINAAFTHCDVSNSEQVRWTAGTTSHQHHCLFVGSLQDKTPYRLAACTAPIKFGWCEGAGKHAFINMAYIMPLTLSQSLTSAVVCQTGAAAHCRNCPAVGGCGHHGGKCRQVLADLSWQWQYRIGQYPSAH